MQLSYTKPSRKVESKLNIISSHNLPKIRNPDEIFLRPKAIFELFLCKSASPRNKLNFLTDKRFALHFCPELQKIIFDRWSLSPIKEQKNSQNYFHNWICEMGSWWWCSWDFAVGCLRTTSGDSPFKGFKPPGPYASKTLQSTVRSQYQSHFSSPPNPTNTYFWNFGRLQGVWNFLIVLFFVYLKVLELFASGCGVDEQFLQHSVRPLWEQGELHPLGRSR